MSFSEKIIDTGVVPIATRDFGGSGPPIVLIHGAGRTLVDFTLMVPFLTEGHRVVALDLRNHGASGSGAWKWAAVVQDVKTVNDAYGLERPSMVGHSLGGMIAALYAEAYPDTQTAVNIDGHGKGKADQYLGLDAKDVEEAWSRQEALMEQMSALNEPRSREASDAMLDAQQPMMEKMGISFEVAKEAADRASFVAEDGMIHPRPTTAELKELMLGLEDLDLFALYRRVPCPLLIYNATKTDSIQVAGQDMDWMREMMAAYRRGLSRDLAALAREVEKIEVEEIDATHGLIVEQAEAVSKRIIAFVERT